MSGLHLTNEQIKRFHKDGLLVVENFLSQDEVQSLRNEMMKLAGEMDPKEHRGIFSTTKHENVRKSL